VGHLRLNDIVQGEELVLEGVEARDAGALAEALRRAVDATNQACPEGPERSSDAAQARADAIAHEVANGPS